MKAVASKQKKEGFNYQFCVENGELIMTDGENIDTDRIRDQILADCEKYELDVQCIGYDVWNAEQLCNKQLRLEHGFNAEPISPTYQSIGRATGFLEQLIVGGNIHHNDNTLMNWNVANCVVKRNHNEDIIPNKRDSASKIDGVSALVYSLTRWILDNDQHPILFLAS